LLVVPCRAARSLVYALAQGCLAGGTLLIPAPDALAHDAAAQPRIEAKPATSGADVMRRAAPKLAALGVVEVRKRRLDLSVLAPEAFADWGFHLNP
jgi:hypothetical protein